ncbi:ribonuclease H-like domain-containing protein [Bacillus sp. V3B]|uniref:ribonuclease H-like domain-containing protein n=1 Tax=Bacillus sp. V3B TaxID=2804915 RepID=UPI0021094339|nr:ribonuclease H-like domain-containing protein [Bacillus sp. V3B]MCQ6273924.1 ribonuclease H-like domain-containing protein [Bacillus sp. V3B]
MSIKNKLNRLKPHLSNEKDKMKKEESASAIKKDEIPFMDVWKQAGVVPYYMDNDFCLVREVSYPLDTIHGKYRFADFLKAVDAWNKSKRNHPLSSSGHHPEDLFFFDTETTGLSGGTGNTIFLLGQASVKEKEIVLRQHILPHPGSEVPLYKSFLENIDYAKLVTYNGKAFDWPQVKTRHTLIREHVPKLPPFGHFDLYHASRRMWKHRLERLKLSVVEKEILEFERKDDIPGFLAPMIYFDFIERKDPEGMLGIIKHNEMDILSLITLYTHLSFQLLGIDHKQTVKETYEIGRWYSYLGEKEVAETVFSKLAEGDEEEAIKAKHALGFQAKKKQDWHTAVLLFEEVVERGSSLVQIEACIELAKIFEHRLKKIKKAIGYTEKALDIHSQQRGHRYDELAKRMTRLYQKQAALKE